MKIKAVTLLSLTFLIGIIGISTSMALGYWQTESDKTPAQFIGTSLDGKYRADDIRGSYTFGEISKLYEIPLETLAKAFSIDEEKSEYFKCKDLETIFENSEIEIGTGSVKMFVAFYLGQPYDLSDGTTFLTSSGAEIIKTKGMPTEKQLNYLKTHTFSN